MSLPFCRSPLCRIACLPRLAPLLEGLLVRGSPLCPLCERTPMLSSQFGSRSGRLKPSAWGMATGADGGASAFPGRFDLLTMADGSQLTLLANGRQAMSFLGPQEAGHELRLFRQILNDALAQQAQQEPEPEQQATTAATEPVGGVSPTAPAAQPRGAESDVGGVASWARTGGGSGPGGGLSPPRPVAIRVPTERIERALSAGCYAARALQSFHVPTSPPLDQRPRVWAIAGPDLASSGAPGVFTRWGDCRAALQKHVDAQLQRQEHKGQALVGGFLCHSFPSEEEATAYCAAAGMTHSGGVSPSGGDVHT